MISDSRVTLRFSEGRLVWIVIFVQTVRDFVQVPGQPGWGVFAQRSQQQDGKGVGVNLEAC